MTDSNFTIGFIGLGLIGGSIAKGIRRVFPNYTLIGMDENNIRNMRRFWHGDPAGKVHLLLEYAGRAESIADPWYTRNFEDTWRDVQEGCRALLRTLTEGDQG